MILATLGGSGCWARNPETDDAVRVFLDSKNGEYAFFYELNGSPAIRVPDRLQTQEPKLIAFELLLEQREQDRRENIRQVLYFGA